MAAQQVAVDDAGIEAWVEALYGETTTEWRNLIAMNSRSQLDGALPPLVESADLIYGEFAVTEFFAAVDGALLFARADATTRVVDVGSGCGRLVLALARRRPDVAVAGLEFQARLHDIGAAALAASGLRNATLARGDFTDTATARSVLADATLVFCYSTALYAEDAADAVDVAARLSDALAAALRPGALVLTTDRRLKGAAFELLRAETGLPGSITGATVDVYLSRRR